MVTTRASSPPEQQQPQHRCQAHAPEPISSAALLAGGENSSIGVSNSRKREHKDKWIYVNSRTGLPVRPPTSFGLFKHALRRTMCDKVDFFDFNRQATDAWAQMSDDLKEPYVRRARQLSEQFKKIEAQYLRKKVRELEQEVKDYRRSGGSSRHPLTSTSRASGASRMHTR